MQNQPLVTCMMPTYGRPDFVCESVAMFLEQDYPHKELIILNDCPGQILQGDLPNVRIINRPERFSTLGEKRNAIIREARGELIAVWDDDDVYLPWRLSHSVQEMQRWHTPFYRPAEFWAYWGADKVLDNYTVPGWVSHPHAVFRKDLWEKVQGYPSMNLGEDAVFFQRIHESLEDPVLAYPVDRSNRVLVLRGASHYYHMSIGGGRQPLNLTPGVYEIVPTEIADPGLKATYVELCLAERPSSAPRAPISQPEPLTGGKIFIDTLSHSSIRVGYGTLGRFGDLGYEGRRVRANGKPYYHSLSSHPPAELVFMLPRDGKELSFETLVAINDDVPADRTMATFVVLLDGQLAGIAQNVVPGEPPRRITVNVPPSAQQLSLIVRTSQREYCHAVWLDPHLVPQIKSARIVDALGQASIPLPATLAQSSQCIATVASPGYEDWVDDLFASICTHGQCPSAQFVILFLGDSDEIEPLAKKYGALLIPAEPLRPVDMGCKSILYSIARIVSADAYLCLDADMLVLDDLRPIFATLEAAPEDAVLVCREAVWQRDLGVAVNGLYAGSTADIARLVPGPSESLRSYPLVVNDGLFAAKKTALLAIDEMLRTFTDKDRWRGERPDIPWRNQFLLNLALAKFNCGVELDSSFNVQLNQRKIEIQDDGTRMRATSEGRPVRVLHFNGQGRGQHAEWRHRFRSVKRPLIALERHSDYYQQFVDALRLWIGRHGLDRLAWSFYGTEDGRSGFVRDPVDFPLFACLHHLVRSNGCMKVLETGTARGVSAACLASAVAHRPDPLVVTLDNGHFPERDDLWALLPREIQQCIVPRSGDSLELLDRAIACGDTYQAALLDTIHEQDYVMQEFLRVTRLVCQGGLILIHDSNWRFGTVAAALSKIQDMGFSVTRLWSAAEACSEDSGLGLAVIENRHA